MSTLEIPKSMEVEEEVMEVQEETL